MKLKTNKTFTKMLRKKIKVKRMRINLKNIILKTNKIFTKRARPKIRNQKNKD
jgi:hypothetical protein